MSCHTMARHGMTCSFAAMMSLHVSPNPKFLCKALQGAIAARLSVPRHTAFVYPSVYQYSPSIHTSFTDGGQHVMPSQSCRHAYHAQRLYHCHSFEFSHQAYS